MGDLEHMQETLRRIENNQGYQWFIRALLFALIMLVLAVS